MVSVLCNILPKVSVASNLFKGEGTCMLGDPLEHHVTRMKSLTSLCYVINVGGVTPLRKLMRCVRLLLSGGEGCRCHGGNAASAA